MPVGAATWRWRKSCFVSVAHSCLFSEILSPFTSAHSSLSAILHSQDGHGVARMRSCQFMKWYTIYIPSFPFWGLGGYIESGRVSEMQGRVASCVESVNHRCRSSSCQIILRWFVKGLSESALILHPAPSLPSADFRKLSIFSWW